MLALILLGLSALGVESFNSNSRIEGGPRVNGRLSGMLRTSAPSLGRARSWSPMYSSPAGIEVASRVDESFVRQFYLKEYNRRPDVSILYEPCSIPELVAEVWKAVLISVRVMEKDQELADYLSLTVFTGLEADIGMPICSNQSKVLWRTSRSWPHVTTA